jgi:hypothetical protein
VDDSRRGRAGGRAAPPSPGRTWTLPSELFITLLLVASVLMLSSMWSPGLSATKPHLFLPSSDQANPEALTSLSLKLVPTCGGGGGGQAQGAARWRWRWW